MKKKILALLILALCYLMIAACGSSNLDSGSSSAQGINDEMEIDGSTTNNSTIDSGNAEENSSENSSPNISHTHTYGEWNIIKEATCTEMGRKEKKCSCGNIVTEAIPVKHTYENGRCSKCDRKEPASEGLEYVLSNDGNSYSVNKGTCTDNEVYIPSIYNGLPVTSIDVRGFCDFKNLTSISIPNSVTSLKFSAFEGCDSLTSIVIPKGVISIEEVFAGCKSLESIVVDEENVTYKSIDGNLYTKDGKMLVQYALGKRNEEFEIPSSVISIGGSAFEGCVYLTDITIGNYVTDIGFAAFRGCEGLKNVIIPGGVTNIGDYAFARCTTLTDITVDGDNTTYKSVEGNLYTKDGKTLIQYAIGKSDESFTIPEGVTAIESYAFLNCTNLTSVTIPNSITTRECFEDSLSECTRIVSFIVDEENAIFKSIDGNVYTKSGKALVKYAVGKLAEQYVIPDGVVTIENSAFMNCTGLKSVVIPNSVISIGDFAFYGCTSLSNISIPSSVTKISMFAFSHCTNLTSITIENSITSIGYSAFSFCTSLANITIPDSITSIGTYAFKDCTNLTRVLIKAGVKSIESSVFSGCTNLVIYCEEETQPDGWSSYWNYSNHPVVWGFTEEN